MRKLLMPVVLATIGCQAIEGPAGPPGPQGPQGKQGPAGPAGKDAVQVQVPHLIVAATGEDLGVYVTRNIAYSAALKATVSYDRADGTVLFAEADCKGDAATQGMVTMQNAYFVIPLRGTLGTMPVQQLSKFRPKSYVTSIQSTCINMESPNDVMAVPLTDSKVPARTYYATELTIELR